ncbi:gas vesicle protein [Streptomyces sp. RS10V-4]|uniref:gas vesicle protein GvpO n=1 Tax=Streptomyces rhizoryzae TaxID=2932493 RepID=UPI0020063C7F|nr:gas vesicle protein [Streptomyces rhizoryzae]MCK7624353.1 gas vesicle protein [Streptomyces rhizoryzae]
MGAGEEGHPRRARRAETEKPSRKAGSSREDSRPAKSGDQREGRRVSARLAMRNAAEQLQDLLGRAPESVSAVTPTTDGWQADVEVLEMERIPPTTSVMASYRVTLDEEGDLVSYERTRRYTRGQIDKRA